jgi:hypothetical protein
MKCGSTVAPNVSKFKRKRLRPLLSASRAFGGVNPKKTRVNKGGSRSGRYSSSNGQLINTFFSTLAEGDWGMFK